MGKPARLFYEFSPFRLDPLKRLLLRNGEVVALTPKAFDILLALIQKNGEVLGKEELMKAVWPDAVVEENNLTRNISALRKALGERPDEHRYVVTIPGRGYQFVGEIEDLIDDVARPPAPEEGRSPPPTARIARSHKASHRRLAAIALMTVAVIAAGIIRLTHGGRSERSSAPAFQRMEVTRLTRTGNAGAGAISPDGKYVAYVVSEAGSVGIWLKHPDTGVTQQILPPVEVRHLGGLSISRDSKYLYFIQSEGFGSLQVLYRMPLLGGVPTKLISDVEAFGLSRDDARLAFVRNSRRLGESALMIAGGDGTREFTLATRKLSDPFSSPAWSVDDKSIASSVGSPEVSGARMYPVEVRVADGTERPITSQRWMLLGSVAWLSDGSGLIVSGRDKGALTNWLWHISYPAGTVRKLTDDTDTFTGSSLTADSRNLVTARIDLHANILTVPIEGQDSRLAVQARQVTTGTGDHVVHAWLSDGRILFSSSAGNPLGEDLWVVRADGTERKQLTSAGVNLGAAVSTDGRYIVFESDRAGRLNLWRIRIDGSHLQQLTKGEDDRFPACSPDGKWVVYTSADDDTLWKVPMDGGEPQRLTEGGWRNAVISPDGQWVASYHQGPEPDARRQIGVLPLAGGVPVKLFDFPSDVRPLEPMRWTPDGQALIYIGRRNGTWYLWRQPLLGGRPEPLANFSSTEQIFSFDWSPDGTQIVFSRGAWVSDVVLMRDIGEK